MNWDDIPNPGDFYKWNDIGQTLKGRIRELRTHTFPAKGQPGEEGYRGPNTVPVLVVDTGAPLPTEVTCSNADLIEQLKRVKPQVGQMIEIEYLRDIPTSFGGKKKIFSVKVTGDAAPEAAPGGYTKEPPF